MILKMFPNFFFVEKTILFRYKVNDLILNHIFLLNRYCERNFMYVYGIIMLLQVSSFHHCCDYFCSPTAVHYHFENEIEIY